MKRKLIASMLIASAALSGCGLFSFGNSSKGYSTSTPSAQAYNTAYNTANTTINGIATSTFDTGRNNLVMVDNVDAAGVVGRAASVYDCGRPVYAFVTQYDDANNVKPPRALEAVWIMNGQRKLVKPFEPNYTNNPHHVWFWINSAELGAGNGRIEVYGDGRLYQAGNFTVNRNGSCAPAPAPAPVQPQRYTLGADGMFAFDRSGWNDLQPEGQRKLDQLAAQLKSDFKQISGITVTGHTDRFGTPAHNNPLSQARANTVREYLIRRGGVDASVIRAVGVGSTQPVKSCPGPHTQPTIDCLLPNRRVEVEVTGAR